MQISGTKEGDSMEKRLEMYMKDGALRKEVLNSLANSILDVMPIDE